MSQATCIADVVHCDGRVRTVEVTETIAVAARRMAEGGAGCLVITAGEGAIAGIVTERDVSRKVVAASLDPETTHVSQIMTTHATTCTPHTSIGKAQEAMFEHGVRHLPVVEDGELVAVVSSTDIVSFRAQMAENRLRRRPAQLRRREASGPAAPAARRTPGGRVAI